MGLISTYAIYKIGKNRAARKAEQQCSSERKASERKMSQVCIDCGHTYAQHSQDGRELCPNY